MKTTAVRVCAIAIVCLTAGALVATQAPQAPPQDPNAGADFLKRPAVVRQTPDAQQQMFLMQPGYRIEHVLTTR